MIEIIFANSLIGMNIVINKFLIAQTPIFFLLFFRYFFGSIILAIIPCFTKTKYQFYLTEKRFTSRDMLVYFFMAVSGGVLFNFIYIAGLAKTSANAVGIISSSVPALVSFFAFIFLKQKLKKIHFGCLLLVLAGLLILNGQKYIDHHTPHMADAWIGNTIVFLAMIPEALFPIFAKMIYVPVSPIVSGLFINLINMLFCIPVFCYQLQRFPLSNLPFFSCLLLSLLGLTSALFYLFYNLGIVKTNANIVGLLSGVFPVSTTILAIIFLKESFHLTTALGMFFVLSSIYMGTRFK